MEIVMIEVRLSATRGYADHGWLRSFHTFSFAGFRDPRYDGFGVLRVINEDRVAPGAGFGTHAHRDMEILSYVVSGALAHKDSMGSGSVLRPGDVQCMSAGTGVTHSEFNGSTSEPVHFLQIWLIPKRAGTAPAYREAHFDPASRAGRLCPIASPDGREGSLELGQDAVIYAGLADGGDEIEQSLVDGRRCYVQAVRGDFEVNGLRLSAGDGAAISAESTLRLTNAAAAEFLVFDLP
jgi:redox-sensitive bicupin YhaK (pirin superfamily)